MPFFASVSGTFARARFLSPAILPAMLLAACGSAPEQASSPDPADGSSVAASAGLSAEQNGAAKQAARVNQAGGMTRMGAAPGDPAVDPDAALRAWAAAVRRGDMATAAQTWNLDSEAARAATDAFASRWDVSRPLAVELGGGQQEGAAGSSYYEAPVAVIGTGANGAPLRLAGTVTLRRVNDVPGATPAQLRWHIIELALH